MLEILVGSKLQLEPLNESHRDALYNIAQDESIWTYNGSSAFGDGFIRWFDKAVKAESQLTFAVRNIADQQLIGSTRYYDINLAHRRLTIGYTWYIPAVWGTYVNPACKYLLLKYAFETLQVNRVEFVTDSRNARSRAAIKKIGATEEGILRQHMLLENGMIRDTVVFSITKPEWPDVKFGLERRITDITT